MIYLKTPKEIESMKRASNIVAIILQEMTERVASGISTWDIDQFAEKRCADFKVVPAFKGYRNFPACVCISINNEVVHGIPSKKRILKDGDIVGLDFGVIWEGWYGDSAKTVGVGKIAPETQKLLSVSEKSLNLGIEECRAGNKLYDIGAAVQGHAESFGYTVVREFVGHGIGRSLHEDPQVPNFGTKGKGPLIKVGMVLAIEPMVNQGRPDVRVLNDGWTAVTLDGALSAHFEHTVAVTEAGPVILSLP